MIESTLVAVLPIGEFDTDQTRHAFDAIVSAVKTTEWKMEIVEAVKDVKSAGSVVLDLSRSEPSLLIIIALQGLSAPIIEAAASVARVPVLLCPIQGRFALASSALAAGALHETGRIVELLYGDPGSAPFQERLQAMMLAARAWAFIRMSRIGVIGGLFPNLISCRYDPGLVATRFGVTTVPISFERLRSVLEAAAGQAERVQAFQAELTATFDTHELPEIPLKAGAALHLALKDLAQAEKLQGFATECWSAFPKEVGLNPCLGFVEDEYTLACEGDVLLCIALLAVRSLTGQSAYVGDLYDLDAEGCLTLVHCGGPASLAADKSQVVLKASQLAHERGFETITCRPTLQPGPVTVLRLYGLGGDQLHLVSGELIESQRSPNLEVKLKLSGDRWDFLEQCFGNHYLVAGGDIRRELGLLCKWLGITIHET